MLEELKGFSNLERISEGKSTLVYRGVRQQDNQPVIIKISKDEYPTPQQIAKFRQEFEIARNMDIESVVRPLALENYNNGLALILQDFGGIPLKEMLRSQKIEIEAFLNIAIRITEALGQIHAKHIIHKDIKPQNIIIGLDTGEVKLSDFGISSIISHGNPSIVPPNLLEGTLAYISPEQTGRMNRVVDYRTDFYSLGVTFYEMLTGRPPFNSWDSMELIHCHIAVQPDPPRSIRGDVPEAISNIVMNLLSKNAEDRYQSALSLKLDLEECRHQLQNGAIQNFELRTKFGTFNLSEKLYGRELELAELIKSLDRVWQGYHENLLLVKGDSGIGKSALIDELHRPIVDRRGFLVTGRFEQFKQDIPYNAIVQAFQGLIRQLLTESDESQVAWRKRLLNYLGPNGQVVIDFIPELEYIIGPQSSVPEIGSVESEQRFHNVFRALVSGFAQGNHPLVVFFDDMQWADSASLEFIRSLITDERIKFLFVCGAYRDNKIDRGHSLAPWLKDLDKRDIAVKQIALKPLSFLDTSNLVADTLNCSLDEVKSLAEFIQEKTEGNPLFIQEFLKTLYDERELEIDAEAGRWRWDRKKLRSRPTIDSVLDLLKEKVQKLPPATLNALKAASCLGTQFTLHSLATLIDQTHAQTAGDLKVAISADLLSPISEDYYKYIADESGASESMDSSYRFLHNRVQEAVYGLLHEDERTAFQFQIRPLSIESGEIAKPIAPKIRTETTVISVPMYSVSWGRLRAKDRRTFVKSTALSIIGCAIVILAVPGEMQWFARSFTTAVVVTFGGLLCYVFRKRRVIREELKGI